MNARSSGAGRNSLPGREMSVMDSTRKLRELEFAEQSRLAHRVGERRQALQILGIRVEQRLAELARHAQQLVAVLIADADGERHRNDPAAQRGPEAIEKLLVVVKVDDHLLAALRAHGLQVVQNAQRPRMGVAVAHATFGVLAVDERDRALDVAIAFQDLYKSRWHHRVVTVIRRLVRGRKLIWASSSMGSLPARVK